MMSARAPIAAPETNPRAYRTDQGEVVPQSKTADSLVSFRDVEISEALM